MGAAEWVPCHSPYRCDHAGLEREALQLKREEARLVKEIKACAAKGNQPATRQLAKSLVRIRQQVCGIN